MIIEFRSLLINVSCIIEKDNEYYPEIYLDECSFRKSFDLLNIMCNIYNESFRTYKRIKN